MERNNYNNFEENYPWLTILLDTYEISDNLVQNHLDSIGENIACHKGCSNCCKNYNVPMLEPELAGISWYVCEVSNEPIRSRIYDNLLNHNDSMDCPFLLDNDCSIYEVRPLICRQFYVKNNVCADGENVIETRQHDIVSPNNEISKSCSMRLLDFWGNFNENEKEILFESGFILKKSKPMHENDWTIIANTMSIF